MFLFFLFSSSPKHRTDFSSNPFLSEEERHKWSTPPVKFLPRAHRQGRQFALTGAEKNYSSSLSGEWGAVGGETCTQSQDESGSRAVEESPAAGASDEDESRVLREVTLGSDASAAAQRRMPPCGHAQKHISCYNTAKHMVSGEDFIAFYITQRWNEYSPLLK